ncbi:hypothetical protein SNOG_16482 [Parastagonospora nodorum SN15]|uniref:Uncharacterized protein n=1 Tax=Phaeosphaeria nodorum (strain SN15 / ATCC MYA-4574 / FGSC 10173) TaxID=321614 RepID=Q0TVI2_PHANO|nr:hypothetical protein SNOG_16482 [Parastagonospora nodorum SN15]EAT76180.1 hypothetical protein SNOG_16482 [Parastagonospora nodorum SN15]
MDLATPLGPHPDFVVQDGHAYSAVDIGLEMAYVF